MINQAVFKQYRHPLYFSIMLSLYMTHRTVRHLELSFCVPNVILERVELWIQVELGWKALVLQIYI